MRNSDIRIRQLQEEQQVAVGMTESSEVRRFDRTPPFGVGASGAALLCWSDVCSMYGEREQANLVPIMEVSMMNIILSLNVKNCSTSGNASMKQQGNTIHNSTTYLTETKCVIYLKLATHLQLEK